jgi:hypothetical protein
MQLQPLSSKYSAHTTYVGMHTLKFILYTDELRYNVMKGTGYFVSL